MGKIRYKPYYHKMIFLFFMTALVILILEVNAAGIETPVTGSIEITSRDRSRTGIKLGGVQFDLYEADGETFVKSATTDSSGVALFDELPIQYTISTDGNNIIIYQPTKYVLKEYAPKDGYLAAEERYITLSDVHQNDSVIVNSSPVTCSFTFTKMSAKDGGVPLTWAEFTVYDQTPGANNLAIGPFISNINGIVSITNIPFGTYKLVETMTPDMHITADVIMLTIDTTGKLVAFGDQSDFGGLTVPLTVTNQIYPDLNIKITTVDGSNANALMSGVTFSLQRNVAGDWQSVTTADTTVAGVATFTGLMPEGQYRVTETTPTGYYQSQPYDFTVSGSDFVNTGNRSVTWVNYRIDGKITVTTSDSLRTGIKLGNVRFDLYKADGTTFVASAYTNSSGIAVFDGLPLPYTMSTSSAGNLNDTITYENVTYVVKEYERRMDIY